MWSATDALTAQGALTETRGYFDESNSLESDRTRCIVNSLATLLDEHPGGGR